MSRKTGRLWRFLTVLAALAFGTALTPSAAAQAIEADWFVDGSGGDDSDNGQFWNTAFETVQKALGAAASGDVIFIAAGIYYPDEIDGGDSDDREDYFDLVNGVAVYGGFLNGDDFDDRDPETNITILSGDIDQNDGPGDFENHHDNSFHVVIAIDVGSTTMINGFTITAARGIGPGLIEKGRRDAHR